MTEYLVPTKDADADFIERRSRFIGHIFRTETEEEALARLKQMREKYWDATHNVYAYIIKDGATRFSDDGEPGGTSGMPTLNVFRSEGVTDVCCVVTRYFGGILLGIGGLVRAYSSTAKLALDAAGIAEMKPWTRLRITCAYRLYERVQRLAGQQDGVTESADFGEKVSLTLLLREELVAAFSAQLRDLSGGMAAVETLGQCFRGVPLARK